MDDLTVANVYLSLARAYVSAAPRDWLAQDNAKWHERNASAAVALAIVALNGKNAVDRAALNEGLKRLSLLVLADAGVE